MQDYKNPSLVIQSDELEPGSVAWRSPSNIAILKYWGKYGNQLPKNPSLSFTLSSCFTDTVVEYKAKPGNDRNLSLDFSFHQEANEAFRDKVLKYLESVTDIFPFLRQLHLTVKTGNSFPHSSGIASSASSMSALALCLCSMEEEFFGTLAEDEEFDKKASYVARLGSGSACRSIFPFVSLWGQTGEIASSSDLFAVPLKECIHDVFTTIHDDILIASSEAKSVSSRAGHALMDNNPFADARYQSARRQLHFLLGALQSGDMEEFGRIVESEALTLHGLMMSSNPSYMLLKPSTVEMIERIRTYRQETKHPVFFSLDAGPNIHLIYPEDIIHDVSLFIEEQLLDLCENKTWIQDWVGDGPEQM
jgi:diphosphomevalonate decarboxylase